MRNLIALVIILAAGFVLVGMYFAPGQPGLRDWYAVNACPTLDQVSTQICDPIRKARETNNPA